MLLGAGGLATGLFGAPGPVVVLPGAQGLPAAVAEVPVPAAVPDPAVVEVVPEALEVDPIPLLAEELVLVEGVPVVPAVVLGVAPVAPVLPLFVGVHGPGATVFDTPERFCVVP